jgi:small-conductance mechanosensitive channel
MIAAAPGGLDLNRDVFSNQPVRDALFVVVGLLVFVAFLLVARFAAHIAGEQLRKRQVRPDMVVLGRRVVTAAVILLGVFAALGFAVENANVPLFGLLLATIIAALGVQDLLRDYVSGYYVLWERHIRVGDHISFDGHVGVITEVRLRVSILKADNGDVVIVPNSELFTKPVTIHGVTPNQEQARKEPLA